MKSDFKNGQNFQNSAILLRNVLNEQNSFLNFVMVNRAYIQMT